MSSREERETLAALFLLPDTLAVEAAYPTKSRLTLQISCTLKSASCPLCQQSSERSHGKYGRTVADVPCAGRLVTLALTVRKFVCGTTTCPRRIFTERLPDLVQSYARMTNRLAEALQALGFATCGQCGERFAPKLGMQVSGPTLLRRMRTCSYAPPASVSVVGIDDWAWKKGATYGTILVDLQSRKPIDLLPDRTAETAEAWLRTHPAAEKHYRTIPATPYQRPAAVSYTQLQKQARRAKRYARYEDVRRLAGQGVSIREIARRLKLSRETIRRFLRAEEFPEMASARRGQRGSILNPYKAYIFQRWQQGCRNSVQLSDEIKTGGYSGSTSLLRNLSSKSSEKACGGRISGSFDL